MVVPDMKITSPNKTSLTNIILLLFFAIPKVTVLSCIQPRFYADTRAFNQVFAETERIVTGMEVYGFGGLNKTPPEFINITRTHFHGMTACSSYVPQRRIAADLEQPVASRSTCPWYFVRNIDENRIPRELIESRCCNHRNYSCGPNGSSCKEVYYYVSVLRRNRVCATDTTMYNYIRVYEPVAVGCSCIRPRISVVQQNAMNN